MNNISESVSDLTESAIGAAGDALGIAGGLASEATAVMGNLAGAALAATALPGAKKGILKGGWTLARRHPYVIVTAVLAAAGFKYWKKKQAADSGPPDTFPKAPSKPEQQETEIRSS